MGASPSFRTEFPNLSFSRLSPFFEALPAPSRKGKGPSSPTAPLLLLGKLFYAAPIERLAWKHSLQNTGRPWVGRKGTVVSLPHCEHVVFVSARGWLPPPPPPASALFALQALHRLGSFLNPLSAKNICSPAVKTNSAPHSEHFRTLSWNSMSRSPLDPFWGSGRTHRTRGPFLIRGPVRRGRRARIPWANGRRI